MSIRYGSLEPRFLKDIEFQRFPSFDPNRNWNEGDEIEFINNYAVKRPYHALAYCEFILRGGRRWDSTVHLPALLLHAARVRDRLARRDLVGFKPGRIGVHLALVQDPLTVPDPAVLHLHFVKHPAVAS